MTFKTQDDCFSLVEVVITIVAVCVLAFVMYKYQDNEAKKAAYYVCIDLYVEAAGPITDSEVEGIDTICRDHSGYIY